MADKPGTFYLGQGIEPSSGGSTGERVLYDARDLTTHGVTVGMTGSGKTGLGIIMLEEALLSGIPALILDPKGDMGNLLLNFPELRPEDFQPWVNEGDARRKGLSVAEFAAKTAGDWRDGLAGAGIDPERMRALRDGAQLTVYTPGSSAGVPLNVVGSLAAPSLDWQANAEVLRDEIEGFVSSVLGLAGIQADPVSSREHILLSNLIEKAWSEGNDLDLAALIAQVQRPPLRKLGVFDLDTFFPEKDRLALAMRLNGLIASPSFAAWLEGPPLDISALLAPANGRTRGTILYLAHLSEPERQFIVTLVMSKVVTWMRTQSGTTDLRALIYMDEVFGFAPPTATPPSKKPILTVLKQARAFGVGMVLSTQNPVDLDYKAMSNAGTWFVGRLQTERDKARVVEGLTSARGDTEPGDVDKLITGLGARQFLLHSTHLPAPQVFTTRWAISYLRGPLTREQIADLTRDAPERAQTLPATRPAAAAPAAPALPGVAVGSGAVGVSLAGDESHVAPAVARGTPVYYLDAAAPWAAAAGAVAGGRRLQAALVARVQLRYDDTKADIDHREEWEAVFFPVSDPFEAEAAAAVDYDARDFNPDPPPGAVYVLPEAGIDNAKYFAGVAKALKDELYRSRQVAVFRNPDLRLFARVGEERDAFAARCRQAANDRADAETAKLRDRLEAKMGRLRDSVLLAQQAVEQLELDAGSRRQEELLSGAGAVLGALLGGRSTASKVARAARSMSSASSRRGRTARTEQRLELAQEKVDDKTRALQELEQEAVQEVADIHDKWMQLAEEIEELTIGLEKTDIDVDEVAIVWLPTA